ncbi:MAG: hypothetical protein WBC44_16180 [Planctomycetaceae bacterium]
MATLRVLECSFLIPLNGDIDLSSGELHSVTEWEWLTDQLWIGFGGGTVPQCFYEGFYTDPDSGQRVSDRSRKFVVAIPDDRLDELRSLLAGRCDVFHQMMIYLSVAGVVEFIERRTD